MLNNWTVITDREAADILVDPRRYRYLLPFLPRTRTLSQAAAALGVRPNLMHHHLKRLLKLGLLAPAGPSRGPGRPGRRYRATGRNFFIPLASTSLETMETVLYRLQEPLLRETIRNRVRLAAQFGRDLGIGFKLTGDDLYSIFLMPEANDSWAESESFMAADFPAVFSKFLSLPLSREGAKRVQRELITLFERVAREERGSGTDKTYLMHFSIVPRDD